MADDSIFIGNSPDGPQSLALKRVNRHGLVAGATGTGKTVTLQVLAESLSRAGVPVFAADIKGDLSGIAAPGDMDPKWIERAKEVGLDHYGAEAAPVALWDVYGEKGCPIRTTVTEMGPLLLSRVLDLTEAQDGALTIAFKLADDLVKKGDPQGLLLNLPDLRAILNYLSDNADEVGKNYGLVSPTTIAAIQRKLLQLEVDGADAFFGEPALDLHDFLRLAPDGRGVVNLLAAEKLMQSPRLYATFMLWLMSELWEELPEAGDLDKPKIAFFFDEAHLLFDGAPKALLDRIEQVARLIRSKGVGIYFVTQSPSDVPETVLAQLGNRVQHALRAYTPADQKAVRAAAQSFRANPGVDVAREIQELQVGEALVSTLDAKGAPTPVARTMIRPPASKVGPLDAATRTSLMACDPMAPKYGMVVDRDSAHEAYARRLAQKTAAEDQANADKDAAKSAAAAAKTAAAATKEADRVAAEKAREERVRNDALVRTGARVGGTLLSAIGRELVRGIFGNVSRRRR